MRGLHTNTVNSINSTINRNRTTLIHSDFHFLEFVPIINQIRVFKCIYINLIVIIKNINYCICCVS